VKNKTQSRGIKTNPACRQREKRKQKTDENKRGEEQGTGWGIEISEK
jgi:hypothetical protein